MHEKKNSLKKNLMYLWVHVDELGISYFHAFVVNGVEGKEN